MLRSLAGHMQLRRMAKADGTGYFHHVTMNTGSAVARGLAR